MNDTILQITIAGASFATGGIAVACLIAILRPGGYDEGWRNGYDAARADTKDDALAAPAIWRRAEMPENDVAAEAALAGWAEEMKASGLVVIPKEDLLACYPVSAAPLGAALRWLKVNFPHHRIELKDETVSMEEVRKEG
jgi:hypothetical protein